MRDLVAGAIIAIALLLAGCDSGDLARHERAIPWSLSGKWMIADLHTHTRFSDGALSVEDLVGRAAMNGCDALALTDHSDPSVKSVSLEFFEQLDAVRRKLPDLALLAGVEWNIPPYDGREHVGVIVTPQVERTVLPQFKMMFDRGSGATSSEPAFKWLATMLQDPAQHALIYNHPLRHSSSNSSQVEKDLAGWKAAGASLIGFEGAPGHQKGSKVGAYSTSNPLQDRWDSVAAEVGGVWDRSLARGVDLWGAIANSDYHNDAADHEPCQFSQTVVQVPERSPDGVLRAIRAGSFWAGHGRVLRHLSLTVHAPGLTVPASPGEIIRYRLGGEIGVRIVAERGSGAGEHPLGVELIGNCQGGRTQIIATHTLESGKSDVEIPIRDLGAGEDGSTCYVRARVRSKQSAGGDLLAYTNPVRIRLK